MPVSAFASSSASYKRRVFGDLGGHLTHAAANLPWWQIVLVPTLGDLVMELLVRYF